MNNKKVIALLLTASLILNSGMNVAYAVSGEGADNTAVNIEEPISAETKDDKAETEQAEEKDSSEGTVELAELTKVQPIEDESLTEKQEIENQKSEEKAEEPKVEATVQDITLSSQYFPDSNFRKLISEITNVKEDEFLTQEKLDEVKSIDGSNRQIENVEGLKYFKNLETLNLSGNNLSSVYIKENRELKDLDLSHNKITSIDLIDHTKLVKLNLDTNLLTDIDLYDNRNLVYLNLSNNNFNSVNLDQTTELTELYLNNNNLKQVNITHHPYLVTVKLNNNQLVNVSLDNPALKNLDLSNNQLMNIILNSTVVLEELNLSSNKLTDINLNSNVNLTKLDLSNNRLSSINLSNNKNLNNIKIENQKIVADVRNKVQISNGNYELDLTKIIQLSKENVKSYKVTNYTVKNSVVTFGNTVPTNIQVQVELNGGMATFDVELINDQQYEIRLNETFFPDENFRNEIGKILNANNNEVLSQERLDTVGKINLASKNIKSVKGIEYFKNITELDLTNNNLTEINLSNNTKIERLVLTNNKIRTLDLRNNKELTFLHANSNLLENINLTENKDLTFIALTKNLLKEINLDNNADVTQLSIKDNQLQSINLSNMTQLKDLYLDGNNLSSVDLSKNINLVEISLSKNNLKDIDVRNNTNLKVLIANENKIENIDLSKNINLDELSLKYNKLKEIDLSQNKKLGYLSLDNNNILSLDLTNNTQLINVYLENQEITLDVTDVAENTPSGYTLDLSKVINYKNNGQFNIKWDKLYSYEQENYNFVNNTVGFGEDIPRVFFAEGTIASVQTTSNRITFKMKLEYNKNDRIKLSKKYFPDNQFRVLLIKMLNKPEGSFLTQEELDKVTTISAGVYGITNIYHLNGIEYFTKLKVLDLTNNKVQSINLNKNIELEKLHLNNNQLSELNLTNNTNLDTLQINNNKLSNLDLSNNKKLKYFSANDNNLSSIDFTQNKSLIEISLNNNNFTEIDVKENNLLEYLYLNNNKISQIDLSKNSELIELHLNGNELSKLDLSNNEKLVEIFAENNNLTSLHLPRFYTGAMKLNNQVLSVDAKENVYSNGKDYVIDLNKLFDINSVSKAYSWTIKEFETEQEYANKDGIVTLGQTLPRNIGFKILLTNNMDTPRVEEMSVRLTFTGKPDTYPDGSIDWTPIEKPDSPLVPIEPAKPITPWTPLEPAKPIEKPTPTPEQTTPPQNPQDNSGEIHQATSPNTSDPSNMLANVIAMMSAAGVAGASILKRKNKDK